MRHLSLLMIFAAAVSFFISNFVMKDVLDATQYGQYSIVVTYFSLTYLFGILGTEQVFLRFSKAIRPNVIETQKLQPIFIGGIIIFSSVAGTFFFKKYYEEVPINMILLFFSTFSMIGMLFLFNILRLNANFVISQFVANYWKMILFAVTLLFYLIRESSLEVFIEIVSVNIILIFVGTLVLIYKKITITYNEEISSRDIAITAFHFFLAILGFSLINFADRFIIEMKFSLEQFGNYFYLTNFFLAPFSILQNYIGFKQLIVFKNEFNHDYYIRFNQKAIAFGISLGVALFFVAYALCYFGILKINFSDSFTIIILLIVLGIVRLYSSSIISAFEARTSMQTLRKSNIYILLLTLAILGMAIYYAYSIEAILFCIIIIWIFRCIVHRQLILGQMKKVN
jgi:hypothetical protein